MLNNQPLVSGIIIFLNEEKFIQEAIESVFAQTYENWELLLVDDGSTDSSTAIARSYVEKYSEKVRYLEHQGHQNQGMAATRNLGIRHAQGEYIAFLDADDVWLPNKLTDQVAILQLQPEAAMVYGRTLFWYSWTGNPEDFKRDYFTNLGIEPNRLVKPPTLLKLYFENSRTIVACCSLLIRREVFEKVGGYEESFRNQFSDLPFYTKLYLRESVFVADGCWDKYRMHSENSWLIAQQSGEFYAEVINLFAWIESFLLEQGAKNGEIWQILQKTIWPYRVQKLHPLLRIKERVSHPIRSIKNLLIRLTKTKILHRYQAYRNIYRHKPPLGLVNWGNLRCLQPISQQYGSDRGLPIDRHYIDKFLTRYSKDIQGHVLEVAEPLYTLKFGGKDVKKIDVLHVKQGNPRATIIADLTDAPQLLSNTFDCFILTQTLQYIYDLRSALKTIYRILKPGGIVLVALPNLTPLISPKNDNSWGVFCWNWGFTNVSARRLFEEVFPSENVTVETYGNVLAATAFLQGVSTQELKQEELDYWDPAYQVLITVRAVKPEEKL